MGKSGAILAAKFVGAQFAFRVRITGVSGTVFIRVMLRSGDVVKILPDDAPGEIEFATVVYVGPTLVEVTGGRWFFVCDGTSLDPSAKLRIKPADEVQI